MSPANYIPPELAVPPAYSPGLNPNIAEFLAHPSRRDNRESRTENRKSPLPAHLTASKGSAAYRAHTYHTKVPPEGIAPFIERYTRPGDVVLDPFCGSGMTGVAALRAGRRAVLIDLSPAATFIAANYCSRPDPARLAVEAGRVLEAARGELAPLYATRCRACGGPASIAYTVWSECYACPACGASFALWDVARAGRRVAAALRCPTCGREGRKDAWERRELVPVLLSYRCAGGCGRQAAAPEASDIALAQAAGEGDWEARFSYPSTPIPERGDEIGRVHGQGISRVDQLFTRRNLRAVATLWHLAATLPGLECRPQVLFCLTAAMPRASRTNKFIPALGIAPGPILGTMYIPGFHPELNVLALFQRKLDDVVRFFSDSRVTRHASRIPDPIRISTQSATDLSNIPDRSIDYAFTDPPFGGNIAYSELNLLWESWLGLRTDAASEAVVSRTQGKDVGAYERLMAAAFGEVRRVLRPGGRFSIVFHNASGEVWRALQGAIAAAGLAVESAVVFDKGPNQSFKQFTAEGTVTHDLVVTCKPRAACPRLRSGQGRVPRAPNPVAAEDDVIAFLRKARAVAARAASCGHVARGTRDAARQLYSAAIAHFLVRGLRVPMGYAAFRRVLESVGYPASRRVRHRAGAASGEDA